MTTNYSRGHDAEKIAAEYLIQHGYEVVDLNWRTRVCEIDIIAQKAGVMYFVEVKSRSSTQQGAGLDYITPKKLAQMEFAARMWVSENKYEGDYELSAIEIGPDFKVTEFLTSIT